MQITHLGHACLLIESGGRRVLIDPGTFSTDWHDVTRLDAVLITHRHPDHVDAEHLPVLMAANPDASVYAEPSLVDDTEVHGLENVPVAALGPDERIDLDGLTVEGVGGMHAIIHEDIARIGNIGVRLSADGEPTLLHPGDSYEPTMSGIDILAVPINAPWCAFKETVDFTRAVAPGIVVPIHDALLSAAGRGVYLRQLAALGGAPVRDLAGAGASDPTDTD